MERYRIIGQREKRGVALDYVLHLILSFVLFFFFNPYWSSSNEQQACVSFEHAQACQLQKKKSNKYPRPKKPNQTQKKKKKNPIASIFLIQLGFCSPITSFHTKIIKRFGLKSVPMVDPIESRCNSISSKFRWNDLV